LTHHAFTIEEANELLPRMRAALRTIRRTQRTSERDFERLQILDALWGEAVTRPGNPDHAEFAELRGRLAEAARSVEAVVEAEIRARGVRFPVGGLEHGLLDFPTVYEGRWVYLCWHTGEDRVRYWHELDGGYRGRQPVTEEQAARMGREDDPGTLDDSVLDF
jgi:hypothetical protein